MVREDKAAAVLGRLVADGVLTRPQADAVRVALAAEQPASPVRTKVLAEIAAYVGAGLVFGGIFLVAAATWEDLDRPVRVGVLASVAAGLLFGGVLLAGGVFAGPRTANSPRTRLSAALFALASVAVAAAVGTACEGGNVEAAWVYACAAGALVALLGYLGLPSVLGMLVCAGFLPAALFGALTDILEVDEVWGSVAVLILGGAWFVLAGIGALVDARVGYLIAIVTSVTAAQTLEGEGRAWPYALTALVAVVCFASYGLRRSSVLVVGGGAALALAAAEAVSDWTDDALGAATVVVVLGALVLALGAIQLARAQREPKAVDGPKEAPKHKE